MAPCGRGVNVGVSEGIDVGVLDGIGVSICVGISVGISVGNIATGVEVVIGVHAANSKMQKSIVKK